MGDHYSLMGQRLVYLDFGLNGSYYALLHWVFTGFGYKFHLKNGKLKILLLQIKKI